MERRTFLKGLGSLSIGGALSGCSTIPDFDTGLIPSGIRGPWPQNGHNLQNTFLSDYYPVLEGYSHKWSTNISNAKDLFIMKEEIYVRNSENEILALNASGDIIWRSNELNKEQTYTYPEPPHILSSQEMFAVTTGGKVVYIKGSSYEWQFELINSSNLTSPIYHNGLVIVGDENGRVHAIKSNGEKKYWMFDGVDGEITHEPTLAGDTVIVGDNDSVYSIKLRNGNEVWSIPIKGELTQSPMYDNGECFILTTERFYRVDVETGSVKSSIALKNGEPSSMVLFENYMFISFENAIRTISLTSSPSNSFKTEYSGFGSNIHSLHAGQSGVLFETSEGVFAIKNQYGSEGSLKEITSLAHPSVGERVRFTSKAVVTATNEVVALHQSERLAGIT